MSSITTRLAFDRAAHHQSPDNITKGYEWLLKQQKEDGGIYNTTALISPRGELAGTYRRVGWTLGRWHDVAWYQRALGDDAGPPAPVR